MYLPEQIVRASSSSTGAAFSIASWARKPVAMLDSSSSPTESRSAISGPPSPTASITMRPSTSRTVPAMLAWMRAPSAPWRGRRHQVARPARARPPARRLRRRARRAASAGARRARGARGRSSSGPTLRKPVRPSFAISRRVGMRRCAGERVRLHVLRRAPRRRASSRAPPASPPTQTFFGSRSSGQRVERAQVALAAVERARDHRGPSSPVKPSDCMARCGSIGWPMQVARAQLRAEAALVAGRAADPLDLRRRRGVPADQRVRGGQDHDPAGRLRDRLVERAGEPGHHHAAQQDGHVAARSSPPAAAITSPIDDARPGRAASPAPSPRRPPSGTCG